MKKSQGLLVLVACIVLTGVAHAEDQKATLNIDGLGGVQGEAKAQAALLKVPGVSQAKVSYPKQTVVVTYDPNQVNTGKLVKTLQDAGFPASPIQAKYICPHCQAVYQAPGACIICQAALQTMESKSEKSKNKKET